MKKNIFLFTMAIMMVSSCFGQNSIPSSLNLNDINSIKNYFNDSLSSLDPIEGLYRVYLKRVSKWSGDGSTRNESYSYQCAIVRNGDGFYMKKIIARYDGECVFDAEFFPIGESNYYDMKMEYCSGVSDIKEIASSRIELNSLFRFQFNIQTRIASSTSFFHSTVCDDFDFIKEYPTPSMYENVISKAEEKTHPKAWTGTGFAIGDGYIVTNSHVADGATTISIKGVKGDMNNGYIAEVVATDKVNDIAVLQINDSSFNGFGAVPYGVSSRMADVGEDVFVLGYPLTQALGNEIKLTNGIISSRTGYQGDISTYQMSAPVQPGNSGGPMFDNKGNVIGIVVAEVSGAENVGYAIKTSFLRILIESLGLNINLPSKNTLAKLSLSEKVKRVKNFVYYIECSK